MRLAPRSGRPVLWSPFADRSGKMPDDHGRSLHNASQSETDVEICPVGEEGYEEFVAFLDAGMRPEGASTQVADDFPVILGADNLAGMIGIRGDAGWIAGLAALTRTFTTTAGPVEVAGLGSVVTHPDHRGQGLSSRLQRAMVERLAAAGTPLAVLWTDQPEIYAGRGFQAAGWEFHLDLGPLASHGSWPPDAGYRPVDGAAAAADLAALYDRHPLRTRRLAGDHAALYGMPGTTIRALVRDGRIEAFACCGKGIDFPGYVAEWAGAAMDVLPLLGRVAAEGLATRALVPAGNERFLERAVAAGAGFAVVPSGLWAVLRPDRLQALCGPVDPGRERDATAWLGEVVAEGEVRPGRLQVAVWGLDSV
ncbi:GNAT family N-acetyltransferase [bacterium]|nr:GNAT family N-acetyltransferase [bacterium]